MQLLTDTAVDDILERQPLSVELSLPLVLDLDGTLFATNTLHESFLLFLKRKTFAAWRIPGWVASGRAVVKERLAVVVSDDHVAHFPAVDALVAFAEREAVRGRRVVLATAADRAIAEKVASRFPFIAEIISSDGGSNLKGFAKAEALGRRFPEGFIYAGDSEADLSVWRRAAGGIFVGNSRRLEERVRGLTDLAAVFPRRAIGFGTLRRSLRLHQWAKNALVFVPLILGGKAFDLSAWLPAFLAFLALSLLASSTYIFNDLWDLAEDRQHWSKRKRPLASGELPIAAGIGLMIAAALGAVVLGALAGGACLAVLALYLALSLSYSFRFKREPIIDVFLLATMFTVRLALGVVATGVALSPWLTVFSMFIFLSLSLVKRQTEILRMVDHGRGFALGRGYRAADAPLVLAMGVGAMMAAVLIMVIYLIDDAFPTGFYGRPHLLWGFPILIFLFLSRIWLLCYRGELHDDPLVFALKDRISLFYGAAMAALFVAAVA